MTNRDVYNYQDRLPERLVHANWGDTGYTGPRIYIENAGDILREFSKYDNGWVADNYIGEKIERIEYGLRKQIDFKGSKDESYQYMASKNKELIADIIAAYEKQPTVTEGQELARKLTLSICKGNFKEAKVILDDFKKRFKELKQKNVIKVKENIMKKSELMQIIKEVISEYNYDPETGHKIIDYEKDYHVNADDLIGKIDPFENKKINDAYFGRDPEDTTSDHLKVYYEDGEHESYYGWDVMSFLRKVGLIKENISKKHLIKEVISSDESFKVKLMTFLDHPWQEDIEIEFVDLLSEYRGKFLKSNKEQIQSYLKLMDKQLTGVKLQYLSDKFISDFDELINYK